MKKLLLAVLVGLLIIVMMTPIGNYFFPDTSSVLSNPLDVPRVALNNLSMREVFEENKVTLRDHQLLSNSDFYLSYTGWSLQNASAGIQNGNLYLASWSNTSRVFTSYMHEGERYYGGAKIKLANLAGDCLTRLTVFGNPTAYHSSTSGNYELLSTVALATASYTIQVAESANPTVAWVDWVYLFNVSDFISDKIHSDIYHTTFDLMTDEQRRLQLNAWINAGMDSLNIWLTYNALNLDDTLDETQMIYWYNEYLTLIA